MKSGKRSMRIMLAMPLAVFTVIGVLSSVPASAQVVGGATANLAGSDQQILAGGSRTFSISINQPSPTGCGGLLMPECPTNGVDYVSITAPAGATPFTDLSRQFNVTGGSGPNANWTSTIVPGPAGRASRTIIFQLPATTDGFFGSQSFTVASTVPTPGADLTKNWVVEVSRTDGSNLSNATGSLTTVVRVLRVPTLALTGPTKAVGTGRVTGNQSGITVDCTVENIGSSALSVTPSLNAPGFIITGSPAASSIGAGGGTATYQFTLTAQSVSSQTNRLLECNANGTNAEGTATTTSLNNKQLTIPVQPPAIFDYVKVVRPPTFSPRALAPESTTPFLATIRKNPSTSPGVDLDGASTKLMFKDDDGNLLHEISLGAAVDVPAGALSALVLTFGPTSLPATMTPGQYSVSLDVTGEDKNGAAVSFVPVTTFDETLTLDAGIPLIEDLGILGVAKPSNFVDNPAVSGDEGYALIENAARKGTAIPVAGSVLDGLEADSGDPAPCAGGPSSGDLQPGECRVVEALLAQYSDSEGTIPVAETIACPAVSINSSGNITGSCPTTALDAETNSVRFSISVEDAVGLQASATTPNRLQVDQQIPDIVSAETARYSDGTTERQNRLIVTFNECVSRQGEGAGALVNNANDWTVTGNTVSSVQGPDCPAETVTSSDPDGVSTIILTMQNDFDDDASGATLTYNTGCQLVCSGSSLQDRVAQVKPNNTVDDIIDGIAPKTPLITTASVADGRELSKQDGEFYTNSLTPSFHITNPADQMNRAVKAGYKVQVWEETNGEDGLQIAGSNPDTARSPLATVDGDEHCTGEENEVTGEVPVCEIDVAADFSEYPSSGERDLDVYVVSFDTRPATVGGPNVSLPGLEGLNLDFSIPTLASVTPEDGGIRIVFSESVPRGRDFAGDWHTFQDDGTRTTVDSVSTTADFTERFLNISSGAYDKDHVGYAQYFYVGPGEGDASQVQYEDRATNKTLTAQIICLQPGIDSGLCSA